MSESTVFLDELQRYFLCCSMLILLCNGQNIAACIQSVLAYGLTNN